MLRSGARDFVPTKVQGDEGLQTETKVSAKETKIDWNTPCCV